MDAIWQLLYAIWLEVEKSGAPGSKCCPIDSG